MLRTNKKSKNNKVHISHDHLWFWLVLVLTIIITIIIVLVPSNLYPIGYLRSILGLIFVLFLPGFTLIKALYPENVPFQTSSENLDKIERLALSLGMSLILIPLLGLILNYTPWGISLIPVTLSLLALTLVLATIALLNQNRIKKANELE